MYKTGEKYDFDGTERLVVGLDGQGRPITTEIENLKENIKEIEGSNFNISELRQQLSKRDEEIEGLRNSLDESNKDFERLKDIVEEKSAKVKELEEEITLLRNTQSPNNSEEFEKFICQFCGKECASQAGLAAHLKACEKNPESHNFKA